MSTRFKRKFEKRRLLSPTTIRLGGKPFHISRDSDSLRIIRIPVISQSDLHVTPWINWDFQKFVARSCQICVIRAATDKISVTVTLRHKLKQMRQSEYCFISTYSNGNRNSSKFIHAFQPQVHSRNKLGGCAVRPRRNGFHSHGRYDRRNGESLSLYSAARTIKWVT